MYVYICIYSVYTFEFALRLNIVYCCAFTYVYFCINDSQALVSQSAGFVPTFCARRLPACASGRLHVCSTAAVHTRMAVAAGGKSRLLKAIKKPLGTIAIMAEIKRRDPATPDLEFPIPSIQVHPVPRGIVHVHSYTLLL